MCAPVCVLLCVHPSMCVPAPVCERVCMCVHLSGDIDVLSMAEHSVTYSLDLVWEQEDGGKGLCVCVGK